MSLRQKLGVFIGSPKQGLEGIREALIMAVLEAGHIPSGMELWAAGSEPTRDAIRRELEICDVHIVILGYRYGSLVPVEGQEATVSFTEWEYRESTDLRKPVVAFLLEPDEFRAECDRVAASHAPEDADAKANVDALRRFRSTLETHA